jgi:hypothetical protein
MHDAITASQPFLHATTTGAFFGSVPTSKYPDAATRPAVHDGVSQTPLELATCGGVHAITVLAHASSDELQAQLGVAPTGQAAVTMRLIG